MCLAFYPQRVKTIINNLFAGDSNSTLTSPAFSDSLAQNHITIPCQGNSEIKQSTSLKGIRIHLGILLQAKMDPSDKHPHYANLSRQTVYIHLKVETQAIRVYLTCSTNHTNLNNHSMHLYSFLQKRIYVPVQNRMKKTC